MMMAYIVSASHSFNPKELYNIEPMASTEGGRVTSDEFPFEFLLEREPRFHTPAIQY
jgi:hypothetical protein